MKKTTIAKCQCGNSKTMGTYSYGANIAKNGVYTCHACKVKGPQVQLTCKFCESTFTISVKQAHQYKNPRSYCSKDCCIKHQKLLCIQARKHGKKCGQCGIIYPVSEFGKAAVGKKHPGHNKLRQYCKKCRQRYQSKYHNTQKIKAIRLLGGACKKCDRKAGIDLHPAAFDFHHRPGEIKEFNFAEKGKGWNKMLKELVKCDLLCAICHRMEHINPDLWPDFENTML